MIKYGLISETDARCLEKTIDLLCDDFDAYLNITEIGIFDGQTAIGIYEYVESKEWDDNYDVFNYRCEYTAIDNNKDKEVLKPFPECNLIIGNSDEVYHQLEDESQHLIFVDGCHCFAHVVSDFFCYAPKIKKGGYFAFHDTGKHIQMFKDFQHGDKENPDAYISVRKALKNIGLLELKHSYRPSFVDISDECKFSGWELVFDEADETDEAGGICVFKKL